LENLSSNHILVYLELGAKSIKLTRSSITSGRLNWLKFSKLLSKIISIQLSLKTTIEINNAIHSLTTSIQETALIATNSDSQFINNSKIPPHIEHLLTEKCSTRAQWQRFKYPLDKARLNYFKNKFIRANKKIDR